jgi:hypothetical protein
MYLTPQTGARRSLAAMPMRPRSFSRPGLHGSRLNLLGLGQVDPSVESIFPPVTNTAGFTASDKSKWEAAVQAGFIPNYTTSSGCQAAPGAVSPATVITSSVGGTLLKVGAATGPAAPFVMAAGAALTVLGDIFGIFGGHHAAAVAKEQSELCQYIPAVNSALQAVDQGLASGSLTSLQASQALDNILNAFQTGVSNIMKMSSGACNAACVYFRDLQGIVAQRKLNLARNPPPANQGPVSADVAAVQSAVNTAAGSLGLPSWALYAGAGLLLFLFIEK